MNVDGSAIPDRLAVGFVVLVVVAGPIFGGLTMATGTVAAADASGTVEGTPHLTASAPNARFDPGQTGTIDVSLSNNATYDYGDDQPPEGAVDRAGEARSVSVNITDTNVSGSEEAPLTVETGEQSAGTIADGETSGPYPFNVVVDEDASAGTYELNVTTEYVHYETVNYTQDSDGDYVYSPQNRTSRTETDTITVVIEPQANFEVTGISHDVPLDGEGTVTVDIENTGDENVTEATVSLTSSDSDLYFGSGTATTEASVGGWNASNEESLTFRAGTVESAVSREYPIDVSIDYTDSDGAAASDSTQIGITPGQRDHFDVKSVDHSIPEDGEGTLTVTVGQTWKHELTDVAVTATTSATDVYLGSEGSRSATTYVEEWPNGDWIERLTFRVGTTDAAVDREYPIDLEFEYTDADDNQNTQTESIDFSPTARSAIEVESVEHSIPENGEGTLTVSVKNIWDRDLTDVGVTATTSATDVYLGSEGSRSATTYIEEWDDGEEDDLTFRVGTSDTAVGREYPIDLEFEFTDDADNQNSRTKSIDFSPTARTAIEVKSVEHTIPENGEGTLTVSVKNTWNRDLTDVDVTATTSATDVYLGSEGSRSSTTYIEDWSDGAVKEGVTFRVGTTDAALGRHYPIDLEFAFRDSADNQNARTKSIEFQPNKRTAFEVESVEHDVPRDGEGTLLIQLEHVGNKDIEDVDVTAATADSAVYLGEQGSASSTTMVGTWTEGENETVRYRVGTTAGAVEQAYPLEVTIDYTDTADNQNSRTKYVEFTPAAGDHLEIGSVTHNVPCDGVGPVSMELTNTAEKPLTDLTATASSSDSEIYLGSESSRSGSATIEELGPGENRTVTFLVGATSNAVNRTYPLDLSVEYTDDDHNENQQAEVIEFRPRPEPQFLVESVRSEVPIGSSGRVEIALRNAGPVNATKTVVTASSEADAMFLGTGGTEPVEVQGVTVEPPQTGTPTAQTYVGNWSVGETRTVSFRAGFDQDAIVRNYVMNLGVSYENTEGDEMPERTRSIGLEPLPEQNFTVSPVESDLYVGEEGDLLVEVTNTADRAVDGVVLTAETQEQNINFYNSRYAVASLDAGDSAVARFRVGITEEAEPGPRVFELSSRYRDPQGDIRQTDSRDIVADIAPSRDAFDLSVADSTFSPGESGSFQVTVTNQRNETLSDIQARLFTDDPLSSEDDSAFIEVLEPGESRTVTLDLTVGASATEKTYSASMDFRFDNARGDSELSDTQRVPVRVRESKSSGVPLFGLGGVLGLLVIAAGAWRVGAPDRLRTEFDRRFDS